MTSYYGLSTVLDPNLIKITQSDLASFKRDRRVWLLRTYLGIRPRIITRVGPLELGSMVHAALEAKYKHGEPMIDWYLQHADDLAALYAAEDPYFQLHTWTKQTEQGRLMLEGYEEWIDETHADVDYRMLDVEKLLQLEVQVNGSRVLLSGKADCIMQNRRSDEVLIFDWKTTVNLERTTKMAHTTEQLPFYLTLQQALEPSYRMGGAAFTMLLKSRRTARATPPFYKRELVRYTPAGLAARQASIDGAIQDYVRVVQALHAGVPDPLRIAYGNPSVESWDRDLDPIKEAMDNGDNVAGLIRNHYQQIDPYQRYAEDESPLLSEE